MSDRETQEYFDSETARLRQAESAIHDLTAEVERLKAEVEQEQNHWVRREYPKVAKEMLDQQARIDAALAVIQSAGLQTTSASVIGDIVKALKGEEE